MSKTKLRILLIDDSPEDQEMCRYLLTREGDDDYFFMEAETGEKGLEQCQAQKPDCVLLDYMLPDIDGLAMLKRLTDEHGQLLVPVVMLTGQGSESVAVQAMKNGAHDYLPKDQLDGIRIAHSIRYAIEQKEAEKAVGKLRKRWEKKHKSLDMNELMGGITKALEPHIKEAGATLEIEPLPSWRGDEEKIRKVFAQLLDNAVKFLDPSRSGVIRVSGWEKSGQTVYCVKDNGIGIVADKQELVFELFYCVNPSADPNKGTGLASVRRVIDKLKGKVWVESEPGKGSAFYVSLPGG
jgi:CheY-like chemotaxis protein